MPLPFYHRVLEKALKTESAESQLTWSFRVCKVYVCVIFIHIYIYVQKIKKTNRHNCVPSEELILCKLNPDIIVHQSVCHLVGLPKRGFENLEAGWVLWEKSEVKTLFTELLDQPKGENQGRVSRFWLPWESRLQSQTAHVILLSLTSELASATDCN